FAAVVLERDRLFAVLDEALIDDVEHREERHVGAHVGHVVRLEPARLLRRSLPPHSESDLHSVTYLYDRVVGWTSSQTSCSLWSTGSLPTPVNSHAATYEKFSSSRFASPSSYWYSSRK